MTVRGYSQNTTLLLTLPLAHQEQEWPPGSVRNRRSFYPLFGVACSREADQPEPCAQQLPRALPRTPIPTRLLRPVSRKASFRRQQSSRAISSSTTTRWCFTRWSRTLLSTSSVARTRTKFCSTTYFWRLGTACICSSSEFLWRT